MSKKSDPYKPRILVLEGLWSDTTDLLEAVGAEADEAMPWNIEDVEACLKYGNYDGLLLTGGSDIDPRIYNAKPHKMTTGVDYVRDTGELLALHMAEEQGIPVLGICRGSQIMCAYRKGTLKQHIEGHRGGEHPVHAAPNARTFTRAINSREMNVISLHHQHVVKPGEGMRIAAYAKDGTPEAIESTDGKWLGVQFHPEINAIENGNSFAIFQWFVRTCAENVGKRAEVPNFRETKAAIQAERKAAAEESARKRMEAARKGAGGIPGDDVDNIARTVVNKAAPKNRPAGTRSYAETSGDWTKFDEEREGLYVCSECAIIFDDRIDRDDHEQWIHGKVMRNLDQRYPELCPPPGHEAYYDEVDDGFVNVISDPEYVNDNVH